jgi:hypothetical protein
LLNDQWVIDEVQEAIKRFLEVKKNENTTYKSTAKAVLRGKFIVMSPYFKKTDRFQINNLLLHLKLLEKQEQAKPKSSRRREIIKIKAKINEIETKKTTQRIKETKSWFYEKINKIDRSLANLTKMRRETTQISKISNAKGEITTKPRKSKNHQRLL